MGGISLSLGQSINPALLDGVKWWPDNSALAADFVKNRYYVGNGNVTEALFLNVTRASTGFGEDASGNLISFAANTARRTNQGLLVEPSATNSLKYSQDLDNSYWSKPSATVSSNSTLAPDGTLTADTITFINPALSRVQTFGVGSADTDVVLSVYLKGTGTVELKIYTNDGTQGTMDVTLTPDWQRYSIAGVFGPNATDRRVWIGVDSGNTATECYAWGMQLEEDRLTSTIKTDSSAVTRAADSIRADDIASVLAGINRGIIVVEFDILADYSGANTHTYLSVDNGTSSERIAIAHLSNGNLETRINSGGTETIIDFGQRLAGHYKIAFGINSDGSCAASINTETAISAASTLTDLSVLTNTQIGSDHNGFLYSASLHDLILILDEDVSNARLEELSA